MRFPKHILRGLLFLLAQIVVFGTTAAWAQGPPRPQRPEPSPRLLDMPRPRAVESLAASTAGTIYVETFGTDSTRCGPQRLPCRTINYGLLRAQQIQPDPVVYVDGSPESLVTVQVGPGTYNERVVITANFVRVIGAGPENTIITAGHEPDYPAYAVLVYGRGIHLDGLTFSASDEGVFVLSGGEAYATNCSFVDNWDTGFVVANAYGFVQFSTFTNNPYGAYASNARMHLWDVTMTGPGSVTEVYSVGVTSTNGATVVLQSTDPAALVTITNFMDGIDLWGNAMIQVNRAQITGNAWGLFANGDSYVTVNNSTVSDNTYSGLEAYQGSFLRVNNTVVSGHNLMEDAVGVYLSTFSHAWLGNTTFTNNSNDIIAEPGSDYVISPPPSP